jgi:hypothetical protein
MPEQTTTIGGLLNRPFPIQGKERNRALIRRRFPFIMAAEALPGILFPDNFKLSGNSGCNCLQGKVLA